MYTPSRKATVDDLLPGAVLGLPTGTVWMVIRGEPLERGLGVSCSLLLLTGKRLLPERHVYNMVIQSDSVMLKNLIAPGFAP